MKKKQPDGGFLKYLRKTMRIMRLSLFLIVISTAMAFSANSYSQNTKLTLDLNNASVQEIIKAIEAQSEFLFFYQEKHLDLNRRFTLLATEQDVKTILDQVFDGTDNIYVINDRQIVIGKAPLRELQKQILNLKGNVKPVIEQPQQKEITGKVTDAGGLPLPGVSVIVKGTTIGTVTNPDGEFSLNIPLNAEILQCSFVGMKTREITVGDKINFEIVLEEDVIGIEEVVTIGYGTIRRSDLIGAVGTVNSEVIKNMPSASLEKALQGRIAGVLLKTSSDRPGGDFAIRIRGVNSINSSASPLYIIDGFPIDESNLGFLNAGNVERVEILKDASATAIYGSRGANGVVLITTKKGKKGEGAKLEYNTFFSIQNVSRKIDLLNGQEWATLKNEYLLNLGLEPLFDGSDPLYPKPEDIGEGTDWFDVITRTGYLKNHELNLNWGSDKSTFSFSANFKDHIGVVKGGSSTVGSFMSNADIEINKYIKLSSNFIFSKQVINSSGSETGMLGGTGVIDNFSFIPPIVPVYDEKGNYMKNYLPDFMGKTENPLAMAVETLDRTNRAKTIGSMSIIAEFLPKLVFKATIGGDLTTNRNDFYLPQTTIVGAQQGGRARIGSNEVYTLLNEYLLDYNKELNEHRINLVAGYTIEFSVRSNFNTGDAVGFTSDIFQNNNIGAATIPGLPNSEKNKWSLLSYLSRINYAFSDKYLLTLTGRYDGCSKFGEDNKWAFFPAIGLAWRLSEEPFFNFSSIDNFKIRVSYGETGNSGIGLYQSLGLLNFQNYGLNDTRVLGVGPVSLENPDLKWETTSEYNLGTDISILKNFLEINVDGYYKKTTDLLMRANLPSTSGFDSVLKNVGELQNLGIDVMANLHPINGTDFKWDVAFNISHYKNKIIKLTEGGGIEAGGNVYLDKGLPIGVYRGRVQMGVFADQEEINNYTWTDPSSGEKKLIQPNALPGDVKYKDVNDDGIISGDDQEIVGDGNPDYYWGINNTFRYKRFTLNLFLNGTHGNEIFTSVQKIFYKTFISY